MAYRRTRNKYGNVKVEIDGYKFDSKAEARRYGELKLLKVAELEVHPKYPIMMRGLKVCDVILDFEYSDETGMHYEDVKSKGTDTAISRLKRRMVSAAYGITVDVIYNEKKPRH